MNDFALDDGELNGQPEVWLITESQAPLSLSLSGGVSKARFIQSVAAMNVASSFNAKLRIGLKSAAEHGITLSAWLPPSVRKCLSSSVVEQVESSGAMLRQAMLGGLSDFGVDLSVVIKVFGVPRCLFQLQVSAQAQARVSHSRQLDGKQARAYLSGRSFERVTKATMLESRVQQWLHSLGILRRDSYSSAGTASIQIYGAGELREGAKINLEGEASVFVEVYSRGILGGIRYRYLESDAAMQIISSWSPVGHPVPPDVYIPAQQERVLFVDRDDRVIVVPTEVA